MFEREVDGLILTAHKVVVVLPIPIRDIVQPCIVHREVGLSGFGEMLDGSSSFNSLKNHFNPDVPWNGGNRDLLPHSPWP